MDTPVPLSLLVSGLVLLFCLSAFFSASETSMMLLNRYRLRHLAKNNKHARTILTLWEKPDRFLSMILFGNTFANYGVATVAAMIGARYFDDITLFIWTIGVSLFLLIICESTPKTIATVYADKMAYAAATPLKYFSWILAPLVNFSNFFSNGLLRCFGVRPRALHLDTVSREELRVLVSEAAARIPNSHKSMLLSILDLEQAKVEDVMIPRTEIAAIDLQSPWSTIVAQLVHCTHTELPVYHEELDNIIGFLKIKNLLPLIASASFDKKQLLAHLQEGYFVPEGTPLTMQLLQFQQVQRKVALVVDEYGDIQGLLTLTDILEEIVGEFGNEPTPLQQRVHVQEDGSFLVDGSIPIRDLNKIMEWVLPTTGPRTLSGLLIERLEAIPEVGTCLLIENYPLEVVQVQDNMIKRIRISRPLLNRPEGAPKNMPEPTEEED